VNKIKFILFLLIILSGQSVFSQSNLTKKDTADIRFLNSRKFYIYKVDKGETLFSISQKFNIPQEEILQFNKDISKDGLKTKSKIWIPAYSWLKKDDKQEAVAEEETDKHPEKNSYRIAIVSTFNLTKLYVPDTNSLDSSVIEDQIEKDIALNLTFTEGAMRSAELLKKDGFKGHLEIIDSENDTAKLATRLKLANPDVIITNESNNLLKFLTRYADSKNIRLISGGINTTDFLKNSKNGFSIFPSSLTQCEQMGYFAAKYFPNANVITIKSTQTKENERSLAFRTGWKNGAGGKSIIIDYSKGGMKALTDSLSSTKKNLIFLSSSNEDMISTILSGVRDLVTEKNISVLGLPTWQYFETIDQKLLDLCNVHIFSSGFINYGSYSVENFRKHFRDAYNGEPNESAFQGYDAMLFTGKNLLKYGKKFISSEKFIAVDGIYSEYEMDAEAKESKTIHVFQPTKDDGIDLFLKVKKK
jgi:LysM repeat protein